jgi:membrane-bound lytic murein transglycosylase B
MKRACPALTRRDFVGAAVALASSVLGARGTAWAQAADPAFDAWLDALRIEALAKGISQATLDAALTGLQPISRIVELDRRQPEFTQTFWAYLEKRVNEQRITRGRELLARHGELLTRVQKVYGVQPRFLVAFWGLESNFGGYTGNHSVVNALVTLAYDERRGEFFRGELLNALTILDQGHIAPQAMEGSWAGAMGQVQFMPSTFIHYAVDFDGDGRQDIWNSLPDIFGSASNFLKNLGWDDERTWGREVRLPAGFDWGLADLKRSRALADWQSLGVRRTDGRDLPRVDVEAALVLPAGHAGPAFLVYRNFHAILSWNRSLFYAISVGHLADRIAGKGPLAAVPPAGERPLSRREVEEMQTRLIALGFDPGSPDGVVGSLTRTAVRAFQSSAELPADGYPSVEVLQALRRAGGG